MELYIVLGLGPTASTSDIKRAYRRLSRRFHPDINPGDRQAALRFQQIVEAYETLVDPDRRVRYDRGEAVAPPSAAEPSAFGFAGFDFSRGAVHGDRATTFGDLFSEVLTGAAAARGPEPARGADLHARVVLEFEEAWRGCERAVTITRQVACGTCRGRGQRAIRPITCPACDGAGVVRTARGHMVFTKRCGPCAGTGSQTSETCAACAGRGLETRAETVTIVVPAGATHGSRVRLIGHGHAGIGGAESGDLWVDIEVRPHRLFRREGDDLHVTVPVAVHEAALGARIDVPTPDGPARVRIVPGTQSGQRFRLRERGAVSPRDGRRGDLIVEVRLALPAILDERSKELLREFGRLNGEHVRDGLFGTE